VVDDKKFIGSLESQLYELFFYLFFLKLDQDQVFN